MSVFIANWLAVSSFTRELACLFVLKVTLLHGRLKSKQLHAAHWGYQKEIGDRERLCMIAVRGEK